MNTDNQILIKGGDYSDVKKALQQWIDLYSDSLQDGLTFEIFKNGLENHIIKADERIDNERFYYLVNYLNYPEGIEYKAEVYGFTTGKEKNILKDQKLLVYILLTDKERDNVFIVTAENQNYKIDFGGKISETRERKLFQIPPHKNLDKPEILRVVKKKASQIKEKSREKIEKRFRIISFIVIILFLINFLVSIYDIHTFIKTTFFIGMGLGLWFFIDFEMLQLEKYYSYSLLISIIFLAYTVLIKTILNSTEVELIDLGAFYSLALLIIQWPTRKIYIILFNREPEIDQRGKFADIVYTLILFFGFAILPLIIEDINFF